MVAVYQPQVLKEPWTVCPTVNCLPIFVLRFVAPFGTSPRVRVPRSARDLLRWLPDVGTVCKPEEVYGSSASPFFFFICRPLCAPGLRLVLIVISRERAPVRVGRDFILALRGLACVSSGAGFCLRPRREAAGVRESESRPSELASPLVAGLAVRWLDATDGAVPACDADPTAARALPAAAPAEEPDDDEDDDDWLRVKALTIAPAPTAAAIPCTLR